MQNIKIFQRNLTLVPRNSPLVQKLVLKNPKKTPTNDFIRSLKILYIYMFLEVVLIRASTSNFAKAPLKNGENHQNVEYPNEAKTTTWIIFVILLPAYWEYKLQIAIRLRTMI